MGSWTSGLHPRDPAGRFTLGSSGRNHRQVTMVPVGRHSRRVAGSDRVSHSTGLAWANHEQKNKRAGVSGKRRKG